MAKAAEKKAVSIDGLFKKLEGFQSELTGGIDALLAERTALIEETAIRVKAMEDQLDQLAALYKAGTGRTYLLPFRKEKAAKNEAGGSRKRRDADELKADAQAIYDAIVEHGKDGAKKSDLVGALPNVKFPISIKTFIEEQLGKEIKTEGDKAARRYFASK